MLNTDRLGVELIK